MFEITGKYASAKVFTDNVESTAISQMMELLNQPFIEGSKVRFMPDCHAGAGCVIGTTMTITDKVCPNLVGVDIGCGMLTVELGKKSIDLESLDNFIRNNIPSGHDVHGTERPFVLEGLRCVDHINRNRALCSIGTLGGGK
jgi:RNA-splicing ligase RtcB